jgi:hypothetical protein
MPMPSYLFSGIPAFIYDFSTSYSKKAPAATTSMDVKCVSLFHRQQSVMDSFLQNFV